MPPTEENGQSHDCSASATMILRDMHCRDIQYRSVEYGFLHPIADVPQRSHFTSLFSGLKALTLNYIRLL